MTIKRSERLLSSSKNTIRRVELQSQSWQEQRQIEVPWAFQLKRKSKVLICTSPKSPDSPIPRIATNGCLWGGGKTDLGQAFLDIPHPSFLPTLFTSQLFTSQFSHLISWVQMLQFHILSRYMAKVLCGLIKRPRKDLLNHLSWRITNGVDRFVCIYQKRFTCRKCEVLAYYTHEWNTSPLLKRCASHPTDVITALNEGLGQQVNTGNVVLWLAVVNHDYHTLICRHVFPHRLGRWFEMPSHKATTINHQSYSVTNK